MARPDMAVDMDQGLPDATDASSSSDADLGPREDGGPGAVVRQGMFQGLNGDAASGTIRLVREGDGSLTVVLADDFSSTPVPAPYLILTTRDNLSGGVDASKGDLDLGPLQSSSGAQSYSAPAAAESKTYAFVYCVPYTVEIGIAPLEVVP